ncbi:MAG: alpha,alpha-trehalase TreF [Sphingobacteriia bacterium]
MHIESLSPLYEDVQQSGIFADSKFFVDCIPKSSAETILMLYKLEREENEFSLKYFIETHFTFPSESKSVYSSGNKPINEHLNDLWNELTRQPDAAGGTLIPLPFPYIVPGGRFREIYYWDSYFTMLGLKESGRVDLIENMVNNFAYLINQFGHIPNGNRTYYLSRSQPPFFALMISILMEVKGDHILQDYLAPLEKEYQFWMDGVEQLGPNNISHRRVVRLSNGMIMNRYWDDKDTPRPEAFIEDKHIASLSNRPAEEVYRDIRAAAESGWDFSSRWFADGINMQSIETTKIIPIDLNCLMGFMEVIISMAYFNQNDQEKGKSYLIKLEERKKAIQHFCWNEELQFFFDYQFEKRAHTPHYTLAGAFPLFFPIADFFGQKQCIEKTIEDKFLKAGGLISTLNNTGQQWDAPNGWAPLQWITYKGLMHVDSRNRTAKKIRENWLMLNEKTYAETGKMMEKYNVEDISISAGGGEYPNQDGFGWTNGVYLAMKNN